MWNDGDDIHGPLAMIEVVPKAARPVQRDTEMMHPNRTRLIRETIDGLVVIVVMLRKQTAANETVPLTKISFHLLMLRGNLTTTTTRMEIPIVATLLDHVRHQQMRVPIEKAGVESAVGDGMDEDVVPKAENAALVLIVVTNVVEKKVVILPRKRERSAAEVVTAVIVN